MSTIWFHCFSGIAGDMALGALIDVGADEHEIRALLDRLAIGEWRLETEPVLRGGIAGTKVHVHHHPDGTTRTAEQIGALIVDAGLPPRVEERALAVFAKLAASEGRLHRQPPETVHFHEVGGVDAIIDIVGTAAALEVLDVDRITTSPVAVGLGMVRAAHGIIPNPAPAVSDLLRGLPTRGIDVAVELTTPTGAAIIAALADGHGPLPPMTVVASGFGAGTIELPDRPNLTQVVLGEATATEPDGQPVLLLETNVDDATGEILAHTVTALLAAGAHDAWITPIVMKKGRPAHTVSALCDPVLGDQIAGVLTAETGSFGVRGTRLERWPSARSFGSVDVDGHPIRVKVGPGRVKAEFDDAATAAAHAGRPVRTVIDAAEAGWRSEGPAEPLDEPVTRPDTPTNRPDDGADPPPPIAEAVQEPVRPFEHHHHHHDDGHHHDHGEGGHHHGEGPHHHHHDDGGTEADRSGDDLRRGRGPRP